MSVLQQKLPASFNGFDFLVPDESISGGKKTVDHEYPLANNRRFVEELGVRAGIHSITAIIHGVNAVQDRIRFQEELNSAGRGLLIHPFIGQIMVVCTEWTSRSSDADAGQFVFDITFKESEENISLAAGVDSVNLVSNVAQQAKDALDNSFIERYLNLRTPATLLASAGQFTSVLNDISRLSGGIASVIPANLTVFNSTISSALNTATTVVRNGSSLVGQFRSAFNAFDNISSDIGSFFNSFLGQTTFGSDRTQLAGITQIRIEEENNLSAFEDLTRVNALISSYEAATHAEYATDIELNDALNKLNEAYDFVIDNSSDNGLIFSPDVRSIVNELRVVSRNVFDQRLQNTWRVVDIAAGESSIALASYRYYGNIDNIDIIASLNPDMNYAVNNGDIRGIS